MTEVYFCSAANDKQRRAIANQCIDWWCRVEGTNFQRITPQFIGCDSFTFQSQRRIWADDRAQDRYILADDDVTLDYSRPDIVIEKAFNILDRHPEFAILSALPQNAFISPWTPEGYEPFIDKEVMEHVDVGGFRFMRKGCLTEWPEQTRAGYDREQAEALRANGFRVGYFRNIYCHHFGEGKTTVWSQSAIAG